MGTIRLGDDDRAALRDYWRFYEPRSRVISDDVRAAALRLADWKPIIEAMPRELADAQDRKSQALQRVAILEDRWQPYLDDLRAQGIQYAEAGVSYGAWFDLIAAFRDTVRNHLLAFARDDPEHAPSAVHGMNRFLDIAIEHIGEAYLAAKQRVVTTAEQRYRAMFEQSPLPMWTFDRDTLRFVAVNDAAIRSYGYSRDEFLAMTIADIRPEGDVPALRGSRRDMIGFAPQQLWRHRKKDGTVIDVEIAANDFVDAGRAVRLVVANDVTDRERATEKLRKTEDQLRQSQKMDAVGRLAGGVAHDFNNVLTVIGSYAGFLEEAIAVGDARRDDALEIKRAAERGTAITRQLLTLSRHGAVEPQSVDLDALVAAFLPMLRRLVGERVSVVAPRAKVPRVFADPSQLEQVLMNLAVNARDAMPDGGRLTVELGTAVHDKAEHVVVAITDTGIGMDAQTQARIFDPFFTTKDIGKGTGLGLSIVHGIVTQARGHITLYSEPGHGTTFRVHLPVSAEASVVAIEAPFAAEPVRALPNVAVLVVDDDAAVRGVTVRILTDAGCRVLEAASAEEARQLSVSHEATIDVALLDVVLADGRGDALRRQLRDLRPAMKIVMMSGYPAGALSPSGAPPIDLLPKPFTAAGLRAAIARTIGATEPTEESRPTRTSERTRVLVADDDDDLRRVVVRILLRAGCDVVDVDSGRRAIAEIERGTFDVIVSDVHMADGTGLDLMRAIRRFDLDVPIILMSGEPDVATAAIAIELGAFRYLTKPIEQAVVARTVEHAARAHALARLRREAFSMSGVHPGAADRVGLEVRFEQALDQMWMAFQPIFDARTGATYGVEALLRSNEPSLANPQAFIDAATQLGRLPLLGRKVRSLSAAALADRDELALFVNLHPEDLGDVDLIDDKAALTAIARRVVLEVTERATLDRSPDLAARLERLRRLGFRIAVDDIGAGYSGLTSFTQLTPEIVKIDMSLVRDIHQSALKQRTVGALCRLCHDVGTVVVGEGVESLDERDCLASLGCDLLQGYLLGRPAKSVPPA